MHKKKCDRKVQVLEGAHKWWSVRKLRYNGMTRKAEVGFP